MSDTTSKKYFLDFGGLQALWQKMKSTFAGVEDVNGQFANINQNLSALDSKIDGVEDLTLLYAPKTAQNHSAAVEAAKELPAGTVIVVGGAETVGDITYNEGFYIVDGEHSLHYIGTSTGSTDISEIAELRAKISTLESQIIKSANIVDENGNHLGTFTIENNSMLVIYDDQVVADSDSINALTHRAVSAMFGEMRSLISSLPKFNVEVVEILPENGISFSTIYLLKSDNESTNNLYVEYIYVQNKGWEKLGEQTITLDDYVTKDFLTQTLNTSLADYATKNDVNSAITDAKVEILEAVEKDYLKKADANFATEDSILLSIQSGRIGEEITITTEQIENLL